MGNDLTAFQSFCAELTRDIQRASGEGVTLEESERLAAKFLNAQIQVGLELSRTDLDCRMRKSGVKAIKAVVYMEAATKTDKKPSDTLLGAIVDMDGIVISEQRSLDQSEVCRNELENYLDVFKNAHIFFRGVAKGRFE